MKKFLASGLIAIAVLAVLATSFAYVQAEINGYPPIVEKIAQKFNLDLNEVEDFFDQLQEERRDQMQARQEERLNALVEQGELTEEQKQALLEKKEEMKNLMEGLKDLSFEERRERMQELKQEMDQWLEDNGIERNLGLMGFGGSGSGGFKKGFRGMGPGFGDCSMAE
jgi:hypothetical protein